MIWQELLLYVALALYLLGCLALAAKKQRTGRLALVTASVASLVELLSFVYLFLADDFDVQAVFQSSSVSLPLPFKLLAAWTGAGGSLLLWLGMLSVALAFYLLKYKEPPTVTSLVVSLFSIYIVTALIFINPFAQIGVSLSNGLGLTPSLQSFWALVHPPTVFSAYTAMIFLFATVVSRKWRDRQARSGFVDGRLFVATWVLLGLGITFGGIWAYQTEGWGGYWAWDPIETSALVPWLGLTAVLFTSAMGTKLRSSYAFFGATFSASTLLFTSYVARGSAAPSVHGYGDIVSGAPFILLSLFPILISVGTWVNMRGGEGDSLQPASGPSKLVEFWCIMLLALGNLALLLVETFAPDLGVMYAPSESLHDWVSLPFVAGLCVLLVAEALVSCPRRQRLSVSVVIAAVSVLTLAVAVLLTRNLLFDLTLPFAVALLSTGLYALATAVGSRTGTSAHSLSRYLTFIAVAVLIIGVAFSSTLRTSSSAELGVGQSTSVGGLHLTVTSVETFPSGGTVYLPPTGSAPESIDTQVGYSVAGQGASSGVAQLKYFPALDEFIPFPSVQSVISSDLYVVIGQTGEIVQATSAAFRNGTSSSPSSVGVSVQVIPGVFLVWIGALVLLLSNLPFAIIRDDAADCSQRDATAGSRSSEQHSNHRSA
jgi:cytochrome c-type biogenesis protein CcmF